MANLPGVNMSVANGGLGLVPGSSESTVIYLGCSVKGPEGVLTFYGDKTTMQNDHDLGELLEYAVKGLNVSGRVVGMMTLPPTLPGALGSVTHVGAGAGTMTVAAAPHKAITITCTTAGALGTAKFTFQLGSGTISAPVTSAAGWGTTGYRVPGTYTTVIFTAGSYVAGGTPDIYTISTAGTVAHTQGAGPAVPTVSSSPIDAFEALITITTSGALGTAQFTYSLDNGVITSAPILSAGSGIYAIPNTGIVITLSGTQTAGDTFSFKSAPPAPNSTDLTNALSSLQSTYLSAGYSMAALAWQFASLSAWATAAGLCESAAVALFGKGAYDRFLTAVPTTGTVTAGASGSSLTVDSASTDSAIQTQRASVTAPHVVGCAGDALVPSELTGISQRRNALYAVAARAASIEASRNIGDASLGALENITSIYRDENATPALDAIGFVTLRTYTGSVSSGTGLPGFYITDGHTLDVVTSDYYRLANARVLDRACTIARGAALPLTNNKVPTTTRNGQAGVIAESRAQQIEKNINGKLTTSLVDADPADAVKTRCTVNRTHNLMADGHLPITIGVQPFAESKFIDITIGMAVQL